MKKVALICAAGKHGKLLVNEAVSPGGKEAGFVRGNGKMPHG